MERPGVSTFILAQKMSPLGTAALFFSSPSLFVAIRYVNHS